MLLSLSPHPQLSVIPQLFNTQTPESDPANRLFWELADQLPAHAKGNSGGFQWISFFNITEEFAEKFLVMVTMIYSRAHELYTQRQADLKPV